MVNDRVANFQTLVWDFRLFVILQTFLLIFGTSYYKTTSKHPKIQKYLLYFAKKSVIPDKNGQSAPTQLAIPVPGQTYGVR